MLDYFKRVFQWGFCVTLIGTILGAAGLYYAIHERMPGLTYEIARETNVLDVRQSLNDLAIYFKGEDVGKNNLNLRIITLNVENTGEVDILQNFFDNKEPWGFTIQNGKLVEIRLLSSNSNYITSNLNPRIINMNAVEFNKLIFERSKVFSIEMLVLHNKDENPEILPTGKVVGIDIIPVKKALLEQDKISFINRVVDGSIVVHIVRSIMYFLSLIIFLLIGISFTILIDSVKEKIRRRRITKLLKTQDIMDIAVFNQLVNLYSEGYSHMCFVKKLLESEQSVLLKYVIDAQSNAEKKVREPSSNALMELNRIENRERGSLEKHLRYEHLEIIESLLKNNLIQLQDDTVIINQELVSMLNYLCQKLK